MMHAPRSYRRNLARRQRLRRRLAFSLIEVMVVISLLATFSLLIAHLFTSSKSVARQTRRTLGSSTSWEAASQRMRRDVWAGRRLEVLDGNAFECRDGARASSGAGASRIDRSRARRSPAGSAAK